MKDNIGHKLIWFIETTFQGAYVIHGEAGQRQYIGYSRAEAIKKYKEFCKSLPRFINISI